MMWLSGKKKIGFVSLRKHQLMGVICMCVLVKIFFTDLEEKTLLEISFELTIDPQKIPGVPSILAKGLVKKVEPIISKEVAKNLEKTAREVELFIQKNKP